MSSPDLTQSLPDPNWVMDQTGQDVLLCVFGGAAVLFGAYCIYLSYERSSWLPVLFFVAAGASIMLEPIADLLGNVQHPRVGQINAFTVAGQPIPVHVLIAYAWYYGWAQVFLFDRFRERSMTPRLWTKIGLGAFAFVLLLEQIPASQHLWIYYGKQPLEIGYMPVWMAAANMASVMVVAIISYWLYPILTGWRSLLIVAVVPATVLGAHTFAAIPSYMVINADPAVPWVVLQLGGLATVGLSVLVVWIAIALVHGLVPSGLAAGGSSVMARHGPGPSNRPRPASRPFRSSSSADQTRRTHVG
jgi:hypothetical protein